MVLLGMKKVRFGAGKWNGFGGKVEPEETIEQTAAREPYEEAGITLTDMKKSGIIYFHFESGEESHEVHAFRADSYEGTPCESDEFSDLRWFHRDKMPWDSMWAGDRIWMPLLLDGKKFRGDFRFGINYDIAKYTLEEVASLP